MAGSAHAMVHIMILQAVSAASAPTNLEVPPYAFLSDNVIKIG